ncbi:hypothetical protein [Sediminibacterium ginsengisoli]|uniref:Uncharacterized protein n=1 Tax=Sediminibacterium ginsengisoli TaxID=413434 RepID=A0A1T4LIF0_9BACT|nr:hypothetical protein [Sediminibacterium ginsengisoli]SJZ54542.1 hypothetical protein SAMN04488132_102515 [Sediminibacterium ginsengisoli]
MKKLFSTARIAMIALLPVIAVACLQPRTGIKKETAETIKVKDVWQVEEAASILLLVKSF